MSMRLRSTPARRLVALSGYCALVVTASAGTIACSSQGPAASQAPTTGQCPDVPASCPTAADASLPTYDDVSSILQTDCIPCHATSTGGKDESSYPLVYGQRSAILYQVGSCLMPPSGSPQLSAADRTTLLTWLVCGAQDTGPDQ
jgi:cytochrome c551/c552